MATLTAAALGAVLIAVTATPAGAAAGPQPYTATMFPIGGASSPNSITSAGGHLFVADANSVLVYNENGSYHSTIPAVFNARAIIASPDGNKVYAAEAVSGAIAVIDAATLTKTAEITVKDCPVASMAVVGNALFYSYECGPGVTGEINHVDLATGTAHDTATPDATDLVDAPKLAGDNGRLVSLDDHGTLRSWAADSTGLSGLITGDAGFTGSSSIQDIAAGGGRIAIVQMSGYDFQLFDGATLKAITTLPAAAYPTSVGFSPDGSTLVGSTKFGFGNAFWMYDAATAATTHKAAYPAAPANVDTQPGGIAFNAAGTVAYTLGSQGNNGTTNYYIVATGTGTPLSSSVSVIVTNPTRYGYATTFTVRGTARTTARVTVHSNGTGQDRTYAVAITSVGTAILKLVLPYSGTATATISGDATHAGYTSRTIAYRVPAAITVVMSRPHKIVSGIYYYAKPSYARQTIRVAAPALGRAVGTSLMRLSGRRWVRVMSVTIHTSGSGYAATYLISALKGVTYKITYAFAGDSFSGSATGSTRPFRLG